MNKLFLDFETKSTVDIKKVGAWAYALHPTTDVVCLAFQAVTDGKNLLPMLFPGKDIPRLATSLADSSHRFVAHNAHFEYAIYNLILHRRYGWPAMWEPSRWDCTQARAAMCGLPLELNELGLVLNVDTKKDMEGRKAMLRACKPIDYDALGQPIFDESPELYEKAYRYCGTDVQTDMEIDAKLPEMPPEERRIWELDLLINRRGVRVDLDFAKAAAAASEEMVPILNSRLLKLTNGAVDAATRVQSIKAYLASVGVTGVESLDKEGVTELLENPLLAPVTREVLSIRRQVGKKNSIAKYSAAIAMASPADGRVRGLLQYHAAHTGRWGGRGLQPQNFPKGFKPAAQADAIKIIMSGPDALRAKYNGGAMDALSDSLRGLFIAAPGKELICADFNAIEARVLFWLAGEESALAAYRRGESPYIEMARRIYGDNSITKETHPAEYDMGKRTILGAGYGMGAKKFRETVYTETAKAGRAVVITFGLATMAIDTYRDRYLAVKNMWYEIERQAMNAVRDPGNVYSAAAGRIAWGMTKDRRFLGCRLPSGRFLRYWKPCIRPTKTPWGETKDALHYEGYDAVTHQWGLHSTYGGALTENVVQAIARDLIAHAMCLVELHGFPILLTVHDEILAETDKLQEVNDPKGILDMFIYLMCEGPKWAEGCPMKAEGWMGGRYRK